MNKKRFNIIMTILTIFILNIFVQAGLAYYLITVCQLWLIVARLYDWENEWKYIEKT